MLFIAYKKYTNGLIRFFMRFSRAFEEQIRTAILSSVYFLTFLVGFTIFSVSYRVNVFSYLSIGKKYIPFIFVGIIAEFTVCSMIMSLITIFSRKVDWLEQIRTIPWIKAVSTMPEKIGPLLPLSGAFYEEFMFRGVLFIIIMKKYPQVGVIGSIAFATILFVIQQTLQTETWPQAIAILVGSTSVSVIGCMLFLYTGSFLPALIAHESFVVFYFAQMGVIAYQRAY